MERVDRDLVRDAETGRMRPVRRLPDPPAPAMETGGEATNAWLLLVFLVALLLPGSFSLAGLNLPFYRIALIFLVVPLTLRFLQDKEHPINAVDGLMMLYIIWTGLAVLVNHGTGRIVYIGSTVIDQFGAYLIGRMLIRSAVDYRLFFTYVFWALVVLAPFAFLELVTRIFPIYDVVGLFAQAPKPTGGDMRMGLFRVRSVFAHPISFGVFCSLLVANFFYVFKGGSFLKRWGGALLASVLTLTSLSTGPLIALALNWGAITWEHASRLVPGRWWVLGVLLTVTVLLIETVVPGGLMGLIIEEVAFSQMSGRGRLEIIEYAGAEVLRNPLFGIGFDDWTRPYWRTDSIDNFYLVLGVRFGIPVLVFFVGAILLHMVLIARSMYSDQAFNLYKVGYLISLSSLGIVLGSVHVWGAMDVFVLTFIGAGHWFYARPRRQPFQERGIVVTKPREEAAPERPPLLTRTKTTGLPGPNPPRATRPRRPSHQPSATLKHRARRC